MRNYSKGLKRYKDLDIRPQTDRPTIYEGLGEGESFPQKGRDIEAEDQLWRPEKHGSVDQEGSEKAFGKDELDTPDVNTVLPDQFYGDDPSAKDDRREDL